MTEQPRQLRMADVAVAQSVGIKVANLLQEVTTLANTLGVAVTAQQLIAAMLTGTWNAAERPLTREEFGTVYDGVAARQAKWEKAQHGDGPEATADAATPDLAAARRDHWGAKIDDAAFGFSVPASLDEFPPENIGG